MDSRHDPSHPQAPTTPPHRDRHHDRDRVGWSDRSTGGHRGRGGDLVVPPPSPSPAEGRPPDRGRDVGPAGRLPTSRPPGTNGDHGGGRPTATPSRQCTQGVRGPPGVGRGPGHGMVPGDQLPRHGSTGTRRPPSSTVRHHIGRPGHRPGGNGPKPRRRRGGSHGPTSGRTDGRASRPVLPTGVRLPGHRAVDRRPGKTNPAVTQRRRPPMFLTQRPVFLNDFLDDDTGMVTFEYAVGMIVAVGIALVLYAITHSGEFRQALTSLINRALTVVT